MLCAGSGHRPRSRRSLCRCCCSCRSPLALVPEESLAREAAWHQLGPCLEPLARRWSCQGRLPGRARVPAWIRMLPLPATGPARPRSAPVSTPRLRGASPAIGSLKVAARAGGARPAQDLRQAATGPKWGASPGCRGPRPGYRGTRPARMRTDAHWQSQRGRALRRLSGGRRGPTWLDPCGSCPSPPQGPPHSDETKARQYRTASPASV